MTKQKYNDLTAGEKVKEKMKRGRPREKVNIVYSLSSLESF